jgi:hypothetical protein
LNDGRYAEFKITHDYTIFLTSESDLIALISSKIENNTIIFKEGINTSILFENDTLVLSFKSTNKIVLKSNLNYTLELNRNENNIENIDSLNLNNWEKETILKFKKRAEIRNCPDLRTEEEKIIHDLGDANLIEEEEEIEITIEFIKDSIK